MSGKTILYGFLYAVVGTGIALAVAWYRYRRIRFPDVWSYPGALLNSVVTALVDEVAFRGVILSVLLMTNMNPSAANAPPQNAARSGTRRAGRSA